MADSNHRDQIRSFLVDSFRSDDFTDDEDIFQKGFVNSMFAMELVVFVEKQFGLTIGNEDLDVDNFRSVNALTRLVRNKLGG